MVQNFAVFTNSSAATKIRTMKNVITCLLASTKSSTGTKFRAPKISFKGLDGKYAKICTSENFPLYGTCIHRVSYKHVFVYM